MSKNEMYKYLEVLEKRHELTVVRYPEQQCYILPAFPGFNVLVVNSGVPIAEREEDVF